MGREYIAKSFGKNYLVLQRSYTSILTANKCMNTP